MKTRDSDESETQEQQKYFYMLGEPILVSSHKDNLPSFLDRFTIGRSYRHDVSYEEIYRSFENNATKEVKLFLNEYDAYKYSEMLITHDSGNVWQSCVFKVLYNDFDIHKIENIKIKIMCANVKDFEILDTRHDNWNIDKFTLVTNCLSVPKNQLKPLEGKLQVKGIASSYVINMCLDYNRIEEYSIHNLLAEQSHPKCNIF